MSKYSTNFFYQHEMVQAYVRILFIFVLLLFIYYTTQSSNEQLAGVAHTASYYTFVFLILSVLHLIGLKTLPNQNISLRKVAILSVDIFSVTLGVWVYGENGIIFNPLYMWIIIGYTIRFGKAFFPISLGGTYIAILILAIYHPFWINNIPLITALIIAVTAIPLFVLKLQEEIRKKNMELEQLLNEMEHQANHDTLTALPNRHYFYSRLHESMENSTDFALLFIDLDGFKEVNDEFGHEYGDTVLQEVAERLKEGFGDDHFIARLGGDEFVCIYNKINHEQLSLLVKNLLENIIRPYGIDNNINGISASIGVSQYPHDTKDSFELKNFADRAMYEAKKNGKNQMIYYSDMQR